MQLLINIILTLFLIGPIVNQQDSVKTKPAPKVLQELLNQVLNPKIEDNEIDLEIDGLLVDNTKTKIGRDFYDQFYSTWEAPMGAKNYTITIQEKPFRLTSTLILVMINDNVVYQSVLQPRQDIIERLSKEAIAYTYNYLENYEEIMRQLNGEDQSGTGIF